MIDAEVYHSLGLSDEEYQTILDILKREPTPTELAMYSVEWSEHCGYPSSRKLLRLLPKTGKYQALVGEDAGGIVVDDLAIVFKMESHNHPSQVEPKQGAATGVGGILRDIFTCGARPIAVLDSLRFGTLDQAYNRYLLRGVVDGIQFYGNCVGVPTVGGEIYFDESYNGNCLVNAMSIGVAPKNKLAQAIAKGVGNVIMYAGSSTGRDGIGGCSVLASNEFAAQEAKRPTVQIGDPFTEKCLIEATLEALGTGYLEGIKDMGAAGLTCCTSEMAAAGNVGIEIDLAHVPRREKNMEPWEVMMSESQERMLVCIQKGKEEHIQKIFTKWGLNATIIGEVIEEKVVRIKDNGKVVAQMSAQSLTNAPVYDLQSSQPEYINKVQQFDINSVEDIDNNATEVLQKLLATPTLASKQWVYQQYDHMVQTNTMVLPGSDAAVLRLKGTNKAVAATTDCNSRYCYVNPYQGARIAVAEAARNLVCSGADPAAVTDCLNFGNPKKPDRYWQFKRCIEGIVNACTSFDVAVVSGNVSFYNESPETVINPTPTIGMIGIVDDVSQVCTHYFKQADDVIVLLGETRQELGASEYLKVIAGKVIGDAPHLDLEREKAVQQTVLAAIRNGLLASAHDCAEGGLAVALAESCMGNAGACIGARVDLPDTGLRNDVDLFAESQSRIIVSCRKENFPVLKALADQNNVPITMLGTVGGDALKITSNQKVLIDTQIGVLYKEWSQALEKAI